MEELKRLYELLHTIENEVERAKLWQIILEKNKILLKEKVQKINEIVKNRTENLKHLKEKLDNNIKDKQ